MVKIPNGVAQRLAAGIKKFQPVLTSAKSRDINENDTATIITDILNYVLGYDKYSEITSEYCVRNTYCDLAVKLDGQIQLLIEVKAIGLELKDNFVKQAIDYAANLGSDWMVLTNGVLWKIYKVHFTKPVDKELIAEIDFLALTPKSKDDLEMLFMLAKEGWQKSIISGFHDKKKALDRFLIAASILSQPVLDVIRRELRRINPDVKIEQEHIKNVLVGEVFKREVLEGDKAKEANKIIAKVIGNVLKNKATRKKAENGDEPVEDKQKTAVVAIMEV